MKYISYETSLPRAEAFVDATPAQIGVWFRLMTYCAEVENGGEISHCQQWTDKKWLATCGLTRKEVMAKNPLLRWRGDTLIVELYPIASEERNTEIRETRQRAAHARWEKRTCKRDAHACKNGNTDAMHVHMQNPNYADANNKDKDKDKEIPPIVPQGDGEGKGEPDGKSDQPERSPFQVALTRARALFRIRNTTPNDPASTRAWSKSRQAVLATTKEEWQLLEWRYGLPPNHPAAQYRRRDLATALNNWNGEILRAAEEAEKAGIALGTTAQQPEEPADWQNIIAASYPNAKIPEKFEDLADSLRAFVHEEERKRSQHHSTSSVSSTLPTFPDTHSNS